MARRISERTRRRRMEQMARVYPSFRALPASEGENYVILPTARALGRAYNKPTYFDPARLGRIRSKKGGFYRRTIPVYDPVTKAITEAYDEPQAPYKGRMHPIRLHVHPHARSNHHVGPCNTWCRAGRGEHGHRLRRSR